MITLLFKKRLNKRRKGFAHESTRAYLKDCIFRKDELNLKRSIWYFDNEPDINTSNTAKLHLSFHGLKHKEDVISARRDHSQLLADVAIQQELEVIREVPEYKEQDNSDFERDLLSDDEVLAAEFNCMKLSSKYERKIKRANKMEIESKGFCMNTKKIRKCFY